MWSFMFVLCLNGSPSLAIIIVILAPQYIRLFVCPSVRLTVRLYIYPLI